MSPVFVFVFLFFFSLRIALAILCLLYFHTNFGIVCYSPVDTRIWVLVHGSQRMKSTNTQAASKESLY